MELLAPSSVYICGRHLRSMSPQQSLRELVQMESFTNALKQLFRRLRRAPLFTIVTLITLAAGVGANTTVFSVLEGILLKPLPYSQPEELVGVWHNAPGINIPELNMAPSNYFIYREQNRSFTDIGTYSGDSLSIPGRGEPEQVQALSVSDGVLSILAITPQLGRFFSTEDAKPGSPDTVIISHGYWQRKFASNPNVIGQTIIADGKPNQIIGVLPGSFHFLDWDDRSLLFTYKFEREKTRLGNFSFMGLARLKPGVTMQQASADITRMLPIVSRSFPAPDGFNPKIFEDAHIGPNLRTLKKDVIGDVGNTLWVLMGSIGMVLLIACANVANLLLVRVEGRRRELAVRSALGASRARIAGEILMESVALGLFGSLIGLGLAFTALRVLVAIAPSGLPRIDQISIDGPVLLFTLAVALLCSFLIACIPVFQYAGLRLSTGIREGGRALSQSREQHRARSVLVVIQVAMALVLLICSGLMIRTFRALTHVDPGFTHPEQLQTFRLYVPDTLVKEDESVLQFQHQLIDKLGQIPGVTSATINTPSPMDANDSNDLLYAEDHPINEGQVPPIRRFNIVSPGNFSTLGTRLLAGRDYTWTDVTQKAPNAIISENFAREYWGSPENAIGKRIRVASTDDWRQIIGVVANFYDHGVHKDPPSTVYWPLARLNFEGQKTNYVRGGSYILRSTRTGSESFLKEIRETVWSLNPNLPLSSVYSADYYYKRSMARTSFTLVMLGVAGSMALLLGVVGIYGVIAYSVLQRNREIGIRMALGAARKIVTGMFVRYGLTLTSIGVAIGLIAAVTVMRLMSSLLFHVNPVDPITYLAVSAGLLFTAYVASYLPSRRAATVDPVDALRSE